MMHNTYPKNTARAGEASAEGTFSLLARVPIYDREHRIQGYELLVGTVDEERPARPTGGVAADRLPFGIEPERLVGQRFAVLEAPPALLYSEACLAFPPERMLLLIGHEQRGDERWLATLEQRCRQGYRLALDEALWALEIDSLTGGTQCLVVDFARTDPERLAGRVRQWRALGLQLLGRNLDRREHEERWHALGFDYGQGETLARPRFVASQRIGIDHLSVLKLIQKLSRPDIALEELEEHIAGDVTLSYSLLRLINSPCYGLRDPVESVHRAVVYLGQNAIRQWLTLLSLRGIRDRRDDVLASALLRARMCHLLCEHAGLEEKDSFFTVGLFSMLETVLQMPMVKILAELPLHDAVKHALLERSGAMGEALRCACAFERHAPAAERRFRQLDPTMTGALYLAALAWTNDHIAQLAL